MHILNDWACSLTYVEVFASLKGCGCCYVTCFLQYLEDAGWLKSLSRIGLAINSGTLCWAQVTKTELLNWKGKIIRVFCRSVLEGPNKNKKTFISRWNISRIYICTVFFSTGPCALCDQSCWVNVWFIALTHQILIWRCGSHFWLKLDRIRPPAPLPVSPGLSRLHQ